MWGCEVCEGWGCGDVRVEGVCERLGCVRVEGCGDVRCVRVEGCV